MEHTLSTLDTGMVGRSYTIEALSLPLKIEKRLEALGMTKGTPVVVMCGN